MADFIGTVPTRYGLELLGLLGTGATLNFTRAAVGSGVWTQEQADSPAEMEALINETMSLAISPESVKPVSIPKGDEPVGMYEVSVFLTNAGLQDGFALREIGFFADHPTRGEILFAVDYAGDLSDYIPALPANAAPLEKIFKLTVLTGLAKKITVNQSPVLLATHDDIGDHNKNKKAHPDLLARLATGTPEILFPLNDAENIGETPIYRFRQFAPVFNGTSEEAIQVQVDLETGTFANPVHDSGFLTTIAKGYEQPAGMLQAGRTKYKIRYRRRLNTGQISEWSEVVVFETRDIFNYVARAVNVSPSTGATGVMECPKLISGPFAVVGDTADVHEATQYRMRVGDTVLHLSPELGAVIEYDFPAGLLLVSGDYVWEVRYKGAALGWSEWSSATSFHTAAAFITGDEAISFTGWEGYDNASAAGVALADDAALRSNGVDQGAEEGDWTSFKGRAKFRDAGLLVDPRTTAEKLYTGNAILENESILFDTGNGVLSNVQHHQIDAIADLGQGWGYQTYQPSVQIDDVANIFDGNANTSGKFIPLKSEFGGTYAFLELTLGFSSLRPGRTVYMYAKDAGSRFEYFTASLLNTQSNKGNGGSSYHSELVESHTDYDIYKIEFPESFDFDRVTLNFHWPQAIMYNSMNVYKIGIDDDYYTADIAPILNGVPNRAHRLPQLTAATGPAGTAFTAGDFNEIAVANATLGTDTDTDRPDFILLESEKVTPATPFRRVAIGASGLSKDSETRISETQCDTWKQGA
ncbi:hypothetical protein D0S45_17370 [Marinifilum sp. JC120]|nr:hypothetical protein D0S45_17370 [Marinifilum sp. JC120]